MTFRCADPSGCRNRCSTKKRRRRADGICHHGQKHLRLWLEPPLSGCNRAAAAATSMRRPVVSSPTGDQAGDTQGGGALLRGGGRACCGVGGTLPPRLSPQGKRERGDSFFLAAAGCFRSVFPPAAGAPRFHSHSLLERSAPVPSGVLVSYKRALPSEGRSEEAPLLRSFPSGAFPQSPEPGVKLLQYVVGCLRPLSSAPFACCCAAVRMLHRSPTNGAAIWPACAPRPL